MHGFTRNNKAVLLNHFNNHNYVGVTALRGGSPIVKDRDTLIEQSVHCKIESMNVIQICHRSHTNLPFSMTPVAILYDIHTFDFTV